MLVSLHTLILHLPSKFVAEVPVHFGAMLFAMSVTFRLRNMVLKMKFHMTHDGTQLIKYRLSSGLFNVE